ncbi:hypothetical protein HY025_02210 [Candidatus Daviesbacteria bacterium]|nr:hypothetical protein [Candidatus Daviesbacteria bacterium]
MKNPDLVKIYISEKELAEAREILGERAKDMTEEQLKEQIASMKYLIDSWMDEYERSIFDGKTLNKKSSNL